MSDCPTCEESFKNKRGVNSHHKQVHGESLAFDTYECDNCGESVRRQVTKVEGQESIFCSEKCQHAFGRIEFSKTKLYKEYWGAQKDSYELADEFDCSPQTIQRRLRKHGIPRASKTHSAWIFNRRSDEWLRREYKDKGKSTYQIAHENGVYQEWVRKQLHKRDIILHNFGYDNQEQVEWPTSKYDYGSNWQEQRKKALERDNYTCQGCGITDSELNRSLEVHHRTPFRYFDSYKKANRLSNLVCYCPDCHRRWEGIPLQPEQVV